MKTIIAFLGCITITYSVCAQSVNQTMLEIEKNVSYIKSKTSTFQKVEKLNTPESSRFVFFKDKELPLITVRQIEQNLEKRVEWYYANDELIYSETIWLDSQTKKIIKNEKQYVSNGHLVAWINSEGKLVNNNSSEFKTLDSELAAYGVKIKNEALE